MSDKVLIRLTPPKDARLVLPLLYGLLLLAAFNYLVWYGGSRLILAIGLLAAAAAFGVHLFRMIPQITHQYEVTEEGLWVIGPKGRRWIDWDAVSNIVLLDEWLILKTDGSGKIKIRISFFDKKDQIALRRFVKRKLNPKVSGLSSETV